jgi:hypothetical protein
MPRDHIAIPVRADEQQALRRLLAQHQIHQAERHGARPLQVVEEHQHGPFL